MFLVSFCSPIPFFFCPYVYVLIDAYNRSALEGKMRQPWISFREPRSQIHLAQLSNDSHPANGPIPFCIGKPRLLYFPFLSPLPHLCVCLVRRLSFSCIISQMRGSHSQILMWLVLPCPELHASQHKPRLFAPSIRHVRRSSPCHCSPLFPFLSCTSE